MIKDALAYLAGLVPPTISEKKDGFLLSDKPLSAADIRPALPEGVSVSTLQALVSLLAAPLDDLKLDDSLVQVVSEKQVQLTTRNCDQYGRRIVRVVVTKPVVEGLRFGQWYDHESFMIAIMAHCAADGDRDYLVRIASNLTNERVVTSEDNGITQVVGQKKGAALKTTEVLRQRVNLAPFRTFNEVTQPTSEFLFRVRQEEGAMPTLALFEADGGKWRIDAAANIQAWLSAQITSVPIVA